MEVTRKQKLLDLKQEFTALHEDAEGKLVGGFATIYSNASAGGQTNYECKNISCTNNRCDNTDCNNYHCENEDCVASTPTEKPVTPPTVPPTPTYTLPTLTPPEINFWCQ